MHAPALIPQADPGVGYRAQKAEIDAAVARALASGWYILGKEGEAFEREFAAWLGINRALGCAKSYRGPPRLPRPAGGVRAGGVGGAHLSRAEAPLRQLRVLISSVEPLSTVAPKPSAESASLIKSSPVLNTFP